jgi:hypothetical protein
MEESSPTTSDLSCRLKDRRLYSLPPKVHDGAPDSAVPDLAL